MKRSSQDWIELAADVDAYYEIIVDKYWQQLYAFVLRRTGSPQDTEDIVQEALVHAYYALERYEWERIRTLQARPWLYKITWNVYCNFINRKKSMSAISLDTPEGNLLLDLFEGEDDRPEIAFERTEQASELMSSINLLPEQYRDVLTLYYFDELGYQEIADLLQKPLGTVKTHMHRGLNMLRKIVQQSSYEGRGVR